jgi:hypothetical protein
MDIFGQSNLSSTHKLSAEYIIYLMDSPVFEQSDRQEHFL